MSSARRLLSGLVLALAGASIGCGSARRGSSVEGPMSLRDPEVGSGALVFARNCYKCHPGGEAGLGPAINNKPLPQFLVRMQVRQGLGAMPAFSEEQISDEQLEDVAVYVAELRDH